MSAIVRILFLFAFLLVPFTASAVPQRIVALAPSAAELLLALDCGGRMVGRSGDVGPAFSLLPDVGGYDRPSIERILSLRPDLCVAVADGTPAPLLQRLRELGEKVFLLDVRDLASLRSELLRLGEAVGGMEKAEQLAKMMDQRLAKADACLREIGATRRPSVLFLVQEKPFMAAAQGTFISGIIEKAGAFCAVAPLGNVYYPVLGREELVRLAPDVILVSGMEGGTSSLRLADFPELVGTRIYSVDADSFTRPSLRALDALDQLIELLHGTRR